MCRLLGWVSRTGPTLRDILGEDSFAAFAELSRIHADGWGLAHVDGDGLGVRRSTVCAATDPAFLDAADRIRTPAAIVHLRWASPGLPVMPANTHPFRRGRTAFAHNGRILPFERLPGLLPAAWRGRLAGTTDSEHYFLAVLAEAERTGGDLPAALATVVGRLAAGFSASSLNAMLLTPQTLYVVNCHDPHAPPALGQGAPATVDGVIEAVEERALWFDLRYRHDGDSVVVASSGFAQPEGGGWQPMAANSLLVVDRASLAVESVPLDVRIPAADALTGTQT
ncbi:MAG TPA: class II glutamine amidotransferase [Mycobacteriales bacterium]|nr:class II glutamine amidotransferase [Mycobacteriales bacterium]